jgi:hypothetical protein
MAADEEDSDEEMYDQEKEHSQSVEDSQPEVPQQISNENQSPEQAQQPMATAVMAEQPSNGHDEPKPESEDSESADPLVGDISNYLQ